MGLGSALSSLCSRQSKPKDEIPLDEAVRHIKGTPFNQYLDDETIEGFARSFLRVHRALPGTRIELDGDRLYIVSRGAVDLSTTYPDHTKVEATGYLCRKKEGDIISLNHTKEDAKRKASFGTQSSHKVNDLIEEIIVTASGDTEVLLLCADKELLDSFITSHPELSSTIASISATQIEDKLLAIPFLESVPPRKISVLAAMCQYEAFDSRQVIFDQDDKADKLYLVLDGVAQVIAKESPTSRGLHAMTSKKEMYAEASVALQRSLECSSKTRRTLLQSTDIVIADLLPGDYFGETALCLNMDRTCKVRALEKSLFLTVHKTDFKNYLNICPIEDMMTSIIKKRLLSKLSTLGIPFLNGITDEMFTPLTDSAEINEVQQDEIIFKQGDVGERFYIIVHGSVEVSTNNVDTVEGEDEPDSQTESRLGLLGPGNYFGEMGECPLLLFSSIKKQYPTSRRIYDSVALVSTENKLRTATVTSTQKSILLSIEKNRFQDILGSNPTLLAEFELRILRNQAKLVHVLKHSLGLTSFRDFLEKEHAGENLDFYVAVTAFVAEYSGLTKEGRIAKAKHIFLTFCAEYADRQINLPHSIMLELDSSIHKNDEDIPQNIFDAALSEITLLMEKDNFARFKSSKEFKEYFGRLGIL
jgi:CRP-like cAMP-binding protein